jgi:hypothetical protein
MFKRKILKLTIMTIAVFGAAAGFSTATVASASANSQASATAAVAAVPNNPSTSDRCVNQSHTVPCWALTFVTTTLYLRDGGTRTLGANDLVLITCYYRSGSTVFDHVTAENAGGLSLTGHINDNNIDLNGHSPFSLQYPPNIGGC